MAQKGLKNKQKWAWSSDTKQEGGQAGTRLTKLAAGGHTYSSPTTLLIREPGVTALWMRGGNSQWADTDSYGKEGTSPNCCHPSHLQKWHAWLPTAAVQNVPVSPLSATAKQSTASLLLTAKSSFAHIAEKCCLLWADCSSWSKARWGNAAAFTLLLCRNPERVPVRSHL